MGVIIRYKEIYQINIILILENRFLTDIEIFSYRKTKMIRAEDFTQCHKCLASKYEIMSLIPGIKKTRKTKMTTIALNTYIC